MIKCSNPKCGLEDRKKEEYIICPKCGYIMKPILKEIKKPIKRGLKERIENKTCTFLKGE